MFKELQLQVPDPASPLINWDGLVRLIPSLIDLAKTPQDPIYHAEGDVWTHTKMVCHELIHLSDYRDANLDQRFVLFFAALLHDIAKPSCTRKESGRITSAGHSKRGAIDARILLWRTGTPFALRERICQIIGAHQVPFFALRSNQEGQSPEFIIRKLSCEMNLRELAVVAEADMRGRTYVNKQETLDEIELFREMAKEQGCLDTPYAFADAHTRVSYFRSKGKIVPDHSFFQEHGSSVTLLSGLPASGKNTWIIEYAPHLPVISFDEARQELGLKHGKNSGAAVHLAIDRAKILLRQKKPFVWNATHLSQQMRQKTLDLLYSYGAEVEIIYLEQNETEIFSRNTKRDSTLTNADIEKMLYRWEPPLITEAHRVIHSPLFMDPRKRKHRSVK